MAYLLESSLCAYTYEPKRAWGGSGVKKTADFCM